MRLIDADALRKKVKTECNPYGKPTINFDDGCKVLRMIDTAPTIEERKTGRWIKHEIGHENVPWGFDCSECGEWFVIDRKYICRYRYCPNCGASMVQTDD